MSSQGETQSTLDKHFDFATREAAHYKAWENARLFEPSAARPNAPVFNIAMPPPNANGELHLGHTFGYTVMDILARFHRLQGKRVMLLPGKDHAGIQTQVVFEKKLQKERTDITTKSREELFKECYDFCINRAAYMRAQEKQLGLSADWSRELFTLDPRLTKIVYETFIRMYNDGLVYRGKRIINWSVFSKTAISDVEVEYKEVDGNLWYFDYPFADTSLKPSNAELVLPSGKKLQVGARGLVTATTRPETMLGDTALAVHPEDPRYSAYIGKQVCVPLIGRKIPIVADERVDPAYGTGVIKVTPAHDFADYDIGVAHNLEIVQVIGKDGRMTAEAGAEFAGLTAAECREKVVAKLEQCGFFHESTTIKHKVPIGERGKDIIEPLISEQWFLAVDLPGKSLKARALEFIRAGKIKIYPPRFQVLFEQWLENLRDWNISRQLWWGHQMPVWYRGDEIAVSVEKPSGDGWIRESDTFDTWFSSGQWAYSTMAAHGLVDISKPKDSAYFPTHTMVMGKDILFFWACRMILLTTYRLDTIPWQNIFFTGLICDEHGQKMSKSKGNGIEPKELIEKFGTDALRLGLVMGATSGNDINVSENKIDGYSKFINKLWNAAKLLELKLGKLSVPTLPSRPELTCEANRWIIGEYSAVAQRVTEHFKNYDVSLAATDLYNFTWTVFCDWYLEIIKILIDKGNEAAKLETAATSLHLFRGILTMLHPIVPFVTEEIYQKLPGLKREEFLCGANWVQTEKIAPSKNALPVVMEIVEGIRSVKAALSIQHKVIPVSVPGLTSEEQRLLASELARVTLVEESEISAQRALRKPFSAGTLVIDVDAKENYRKRLEKDLEQHQQTVKSIEAKLSGSFAERAKPEIVEKERERLAISQRSAVEIERELALLQ